VVLFGVFPFPQVFSHLGFPESNDFSFSSSLLFSACHKILVFFALESLINLGSGGYWKILIGIVCLV